MRFQYHYPPPLVATDCYCTQHYVAVFNTLCLSSLQPAIVLAPIHCTQTAEPQVEVPAAKPEPQSPEPQNPEPQNPEPQSGSGESPQQRPPADATPAEDDQHEGKSD